jgi:hypothetical protein
MRELGARHADLEARRDLEGTMATLVEDPVYKFWPLGRGMRGRDQVLRYYQHLFGEFIPRTRFYTLLSEWVNEDSVAQEYSIELDIDGALERHRVIGILVREGHLLGGERVYASELCARRMLGPLFDELTPL